jgi:hypothetical protein
MSVNGAPGMAASVVAVDVGKNTAVLSVTDAARRRLLGPVDFTMTAPAVAAVVERVCAVLPAAAVRVGIEAEAPNWCWRVIGCRSRLGLDGARSPSTRRCPDTRAGLNSNTTESRSWRPS